MAVDLFKLQGSVEVSTGKAEASLKKIDADAKKTHGSLNTLGDGGKRAGSSIASGLDHGTASAHKLHGALGVVSSGLSKLQSAGSGLSGILNIAGGNLLSGAISSAISGVTGAMKEGWTRGIEYQRMLENSTVRLSRFFETAQQTSAFTSQVERFAAISPIFEMKEAATGAQRLLQMKFKAQEVVPALAAIGDMVGGVGGGKEEIDRVTLALSQMVGKGKLMSEEMSQLAEAGVPAWELLSKAIGKTEAQTRALVEAGRIDAKQGVRGIIAMGGKTFQGQSDKAGQTLSGREAQFNSALDMQLAKATQGNFGQLKDAYSKGAEGLSTNSANGFSGEVDKLLTDMGKLVTDDINKFATGEYFKQGATAISKGYEASSEFGKGNYGKGLSATKDAIEATTGQPLYDWKSAGTTGGGALGALTGGKPVTLGGIAEKFGLLGSSAADSFSKGVASKAGDAQTAGTVVGTGAETGVRTSLDQHSPSKVMIDLGSSAAQSFVDAFSGAMENGKGKVSKSPIDVAKMQEAIRADLEKLLADPKIKAMLDTIAKAEGTGGSYNMKFGGGRFNDLSSHPNDAVTRTMGGKSITSTAAGRYQFLNRTWGGLQDQLGLPDFSAHSQDLGAVALMKQRGMIGKIQGGDVAGALTAGNREWASLPGSPYGQPTKKAEELTTAYNAALEKYAGVMGTAGGALDSLTAKIESLGKTAIAYFGGGAMGATIAAPALPKPASLPPPTRPGDGASAKPYEKVAALLPDIKPVAAALAPLATNIQNLTPPAMTAAKAVSGIPKPTEDASKSIQSLAWTAEDASKTILAAGKTWKEAAAAYQESLDLVLSGGEKFKRFHQFGDQIGQDFDDFIDSMMEGKAKFSDLGKSLFKDIFKGLTKELMLNATGGKYSSPGQAIGGAIAGIFKPSFNGQGAASSGSGTPDGTNGGSGSAGGAGAASPSGGGPSSVSGALDTAKSIGGLFKQGGMLGKGGLLSKIPGMGKMGGLLGKIPGLGKLGGMFGGLFGGGAGAGAGAGGAAAGSGGLLAAAGGPVGIGIMAATMIGMPLLKKLFTHNYEKDFRNLIKSEYGINASKQMIAKIMSIGQSKFGTEWPHREIETVRLPEVRDMLAEYGSAFNKGGNSKLFSGAEFSDQFSAVNQIKVGMRANGGPVMAGMPYVVGERRPELFIPNTSGRIEPSVSGRRGGGMIGGMNPEFLAMIERLTASLDRFESMPPEHVVSTGLANKPGMATADVRKSFDTRDEHSRAIRDLTLTR